jgi:hypothetical protein
MNVRTRRVWTRASVGALALFSAAAVAALGSPAYADGGADLALTVSGEKIAADVSSKLFFVKLHNNGPDTATGIKLQFDLSDLTDEITNFRVTGQICEESDDGKIVCPFEDMPLDADFTAKIPLELSHDPGSTGDAGSFTVTVLSDADPIADNNSKTVNVEIPGSGVDIGVLADDVFKLAKSEQDAQQPVPPGGEGLFRGLIFNQGDTVAGDLVFSVDLPEHVTLGSSDPSCTASSDKRTVTCQAEDLILIPADQDTDEDDDLFSVIEVAFPVKVAEDAPGPVVLPGGVFAATGRAISVDLATLDRARTTVKLPANVKPLSPVEIKDLDPTDNTDEFAVHVDAPATGGGPPTSGGGEGGGLPVTGMQVGLIGGIGGGILVTGAVLFIIARRRRVVLVTPDDEEPNA